MMKRPGLLASAMALASLLLRCSSDDTVSPGGKPDGAASSGGSGGMVAASGGTASGGTASGSGGTASGGTASGGTASGGTASGNGGTASGGAAAGAPSSGGTAGAAGGAAGGGFSTGGSSPGGSGGVSTGTGGAPASLGPRRTACEGASNPGDPLPANRTATLVKNGFGFIEGPVWLAERSTLYFSDMNFSGGDAAGPPSRIHSLSLAGGSATFGVLVASSGSNGLALSLDGRILAATHDSQSLSYFDPVNGARGDWPLTVGGRRFNSPNDLVARADGNVYFTDPSWQLGSRTSQTGIEGLYRVSPGGTVTLIDDTFDRVNGVTLSPDENTLYAAGSSGGIWAFSLDAAGTPSNKRRFADGSSDGMTVDCAGNVYTTQRDVVVHDPATGNERGRITVPSPSNVAFGGPARKTLYITAGGSLYSLETNVRGMPY